MVRNDKSHLTILICLGLGIVTLGVYWPVTHSQFLDYDDPIYVTGNAHVLQGLSWETIRWAFINVDAGFWHPLTWLSHLLDVTLFGMDAGGHHATAMLIHIANTLLVFLSLRQLTGAQWRSAMVAALFALHPLHVESVAWVAERKDVLSTLFFLLTLLCYAKYVQRVETLAEEKSEIRNPNPERSPKPEIRNPMGADDNREPSSGFGLWTLVAHHASFFYLLSLFFFLCGIMSKTLVVTLPAVLLLLDWWPLNRIKLSWSDLRQKGLRLFGEKIPFMVLSVASVGLTIFAEKQIGAVSFSTAPPLKIRLMNALLAYVRYLGKTVWPSHLAAFYPYPHEFSMWQVAGAAVLLAGLTAMALALRRRPYFAVGWFWFVGTLVPMIGLIQIGDHSMADRYSYVPLVGLFLAVVWWAAEIAERGMAAKAGMAVAGAAILAVCAVLTSKQVSYWQNTRSLFEHTVAVTRDNAVAQNDLGVCLLNDGDLAGAEAHLAEAVRIQTNYASALVNLGNCYQMQGRLPEAIAVQQKAVQFQPTAIAHYNLGFSLMEAGNLEGAESHLRSAVQLYPAYAKAWYNLGLVEARRHNDAEAAKAFAELLRLQPDAAVAQLQLGSALARQQKWIEASVHLESGLEALPGNLEARQDLGVALFSQGKVSEAVPQLEAALEGAADARTHYYLALALHTQGRFQDALPHYREAVRLDPLTPDYLNDLAWILATCREPEVRDGKEAVRLAEQACQLSGGKEARWWGTLDASYAEAGRFDEAVATATKARQMALAAGQKDLAQAAEKRLEVYRSRQPYRQ